MRSYRIALHFCQRWRWGQGRIDLLPEFLELSSRRFELTDEVSVRSLDRLDVRDG